MSNIFINREVRVLSSREQARLIRNEALSILEKVNEFSSTSRRVGKRAAYKVISRSLFKSRGLPFSIRKYQALSDLSEYISLAKYNKVNGFKAFNTDLLPVSHPRSTKLSTMTASAMLEAQMQWVIDDPQITDDSVKSLIASAMMSHPDSPEHIYSMKRIELLPQGTVPLEALVAAYGDGNSRAARSARAKLQRRDRKGRFAEMFGTFKLILGLRDGGKASATGRILGQNIFSPDLLDMELPDGRIAAVPIIQGEQPEGMLDDVSPEAREKGFVRASDADIDKNAPVVDEDSIVFMDAPSGFRQDKDYKGPGKKYTDEAFDVTVFDGPSPQTRDLIDDSIKRSREIGLEDPRQIKLGEDGKLWDPDRKLFAVNRRGEQTKFAFAQNWKDALEETRRKERIDDQEQFEQGEDEETSPLADQLKGSPKKKSEKKEKAKLPEKGFNYNIPKGSLELDPDYNYIPEGTQDDPSMLAAMQSEDDLQSGLVDALDPVSATKPATGLGRLEDENGEEFEVPAEAILSAIGEQGGDKEMALAKAYDTINNNSENEKALEENRKKTKKDKAADPKELDEVFDEVVSEEPEKPIADILETEEEISQDPAAKKEETLEDINGTPALEGLSREEQEQIASTGDYRSFIPKNEDINFPEGMYKPNESNAEDREEALKLAAAKNMPNNSLIEGLQDAIKNGGKSDVLSFDENGELVPTPISAEAWRDAVALRGRDANKILKEIADGSLDLDKEKKEDESNAKKKQKAAAKKWQKRRDDLIKDLGIEKDSWNESDILKPIERAQNLFGDDPAYEQDINELIESYKSFLEGKDLNKYDDAEAGLKEFKEAVDGITEEDEDYKKLVDAVSEAVDESLASIAEWRKRNPEAGGDEPKTEEEEDTSTPTPTPTSEPEPEADTEPAPETTPTPEPEVKPEAETPAEEPKKKSRKKKAELPPEAPTDGGGPTDEEPPKKIITYKRAGRRTLLRGGKGAPFRDKEIADFLVENGFEWSDTVERDGKTINVKAQTALQDDEEFKAFARELRDRFGIDLQPRAGEEPIDFDAPAPVKEEPAPTPEPTPSPETPAPSKKERDIADLENELEMLERLIKQDDVKPDVKDKMAKRIEKVKKDIAELKEPSEEPTSTLTPTLEPDPVDLFENKLREEIENLEKEEISLSNKKDSDEESAKKLEQVKERLEFLSKVYKNFRDLKEKIETARRVLYEKEVKLSPEQKQNAVDKLAKYSDDLDNLIKLFDEDTVDATVKDAIIDNVVNPENPSTVDGLLDKIKNKLKEKGEKRFGEPKEEGLFGSRKDMISRLMWFKWGAGAVKNESIYIQMAMKKYKKELEKLTDQELTDILNLYYDEMDARLAEQNEKTERNRKLAEARAKKRKEREDKLLEDSEEKPEGTPTDEETPAVAEEKPLPLSAKAKEILKALVDRRRKIQRKIDKADLSETATPAQKKALKDELDEITRIIDEIVLGEKPAESVETPVSPTPSEETPEVKTTPASSLVKKMNVRSSELKPGDIIVGDHFVITDVKPEGTKKVKVEGVTQDVPAYRISGYFPGSVEQSSKLWSDDYAPEIYRGATPPVKGDLPELNQPKAEDYGAEYAFPNQKKVKYKDRTLYAPKNEELEKKFLEDYKAYDEERLRRKAMWSAPEIISENDEEQSGSPVTPKNTLYTDNVVASEVQVGDIAFRRDKDGLKEFFVVTNVVGTKDGVTTLEGHYVGHQTQTKEWRAGTTIDVIRGETNLPASGDKEPLDRPDKELPNYKELEKARKEKIAEADKGYTPNFPTSKAFQGITPLATKPQLPAFYGSAEEFLALGDGPEIMKALDEAGFIVVDFETIGKDVTNAVNPDAPIQVAASKYKNGEKVETLNLFINPGEPLGQYYRTQEDNKTPYLDKDGNPALNPKKILKSGDQDVTDEWLATQPAVSDQLKKLVEFMGENPILVGQNNTFDINLLQRWSEKLGINFSMAGSVDTLAIAQILQKIEMATIEFPSNPKDEDKFEVNGQIWQWSESSKKWKSSNKLSLLAQRLGVETKTEGDFHDAAFDIDVTEKVLRKLMERVKAGDLPTGGTKKYDKKYSDWLESRKQREKDISEIEAAKIMSGKGSSIDEAVGKVKGATDDKVEVIDGEENIVTPKVHTSKIYGDQINEDWVKDPENTEFIPNARVKDLKPGDFIVGKNGNIQEVIGFGDDEKDPANAIKVFRQDIEDGIILEDRATERPDGGTGWFLSGKLEGGIYRRISNINKTNTEIIDDAPKPEPVSETPVVVEPVEPVKGEELTEDQISTVAANVVDDITSGVKPEATIDEAVKGANVDETIKEQVLGADRAKVSEHLTKEGIQLSKGDRVINNKNKKTGRIASFFKAYGKAGYSNYVKVKYDDGTKGPVASDSLSIIDAASDTYTPRIIRSSDILRPPTKSSTKTVQDVIETIKNIQSQPTPEGVDKPENIPNPEELGKTWKDKEEERNSIAKELNFVSTSPEIVSAIKNNIPAKISTESFMPSLKTGEPMTVRFGFDKPTGREISSYSGQMNISSPEDILVFKATAEYINRKDQIATIKPDGTIVWVGEKQKNANSIDLKNALDSYTNPVIGLQAMIVQPEEDDEEPLATSLGINDSDFDYGKIAKFTPTFEQKAVIEAVMTGKNVVVRALAGTGKTSTLKLAAKRLQEEKPDKNITYIVFNKAAQEESAKEFPKNTDVRTVDSIGYNNVSTELRSKVDKGKFLGNSPDIAKLLGVTPTLVNVKGTETTLGSKEIPRILRDAVDKFTASDDDVITAKHFAGMNLDTIPEQFVGWANKMWEDISSPAGELYTSFSDLTKVWALSKPDLSQGIFGGIAKKDEKRKVDIVLYDEAQDINPVMAKVMREQTNIQSVFVGDSNQAIYGFRGAVDELDNITADYDLPITETFRFGEDIAGIANRFLTKLGSKYRVKGVKGKAGQILDEMDDPTVIITKTNGGGISAALEMLEKGKVVGIDEKTYNDYMLLIKDIEYLKFADKGGGKSSYRRPHKDLASFSNWSELVEAKRRGESLGSAAYMVNILDKRNTTEIKDILSRIVKLSNREAPKTPFVPLTAEELKDKSTGVLGKYYAPGQRYPFKVEYTVDKNNLDIRNGSEYARLLKEEGFESVKVQGKDKDGKDIEYSVYRKQSNNLAEILPLLNTIKRQASGYPPEKPVEVEIVTAHKAKGKQWKRVRIYSDFNGPEISEEDGELKLPSPEEQRLSYVAVTRAEEALELGSLAWILDVTSEEDEKPNITEIEEIIGMTVTPSPEPVTPEEAGNEVTKVRKITDEKTLEVANRLIALIEKGVVPWTKGWSGGGFLPTNGKTKKSYQGTNVLALWAAMAENDWADPRFLTFNQGKELEGFVRKGEKGTKILKPNVVTKEVKQPDGTLKKEGYVYFTEATVFNVSQFENLTLPPLVKRDPVPVSEIETQILESYKDHPEIIYRPQDKAFYRPSEDKIYLPLRNQFDSNSAFIETLFHELGHSTGHISRLGKEGKRKDLQDNYGDHRASRGEEELIAEITVALIAAEFGVEIDWGNTAAYADFWLKPLKDDPGMLILAAKQAQDAVNWMLGVKPEDRNATPEPNTQAPEAGEGVGSEGKTGEQIAEEKPETPEATPEPNVGEQGQTGEEIANKAPKNKDTSKEPTKITINDEEFDLWDDITYDRESESGQDNKNLEQVHGVFSSRILSGQQLVTDRNEIGKYISDILKKYGYGNKLFYLASGSTSDKMLGKDPMTSEEGGTEAGVGLANSNTFLEGDPLKDVVFPVFLIRKRGISKVALLHEIAHAMEGGWQTGQGGGHSLIWHQTWLTLLRQEGFQKEANLLALSIGEQKGDTGVINP